MPINSMKDYDNYKRMLDEVFIYAVSQDWRGDRNILWNITNPYQSTYYFSKDMTLKDAQERLNGVIGRNKNDFIMILPIYELWDIKGVIWETDFLKAVFGEYKIPHGTIVSPESMKGQISYTQIWKSAPIEMIQMDFEERIEFLYDWIQPKEQGCS